MKELSVLIKPASSKCNMACRYCFYRDEAGRRHNADSGMMNDTTMRSLIDKTLALYADNATVNYIFQGGEPTCAGLSFFEAFTEYVSKVKKPSQMISYSLQTNGLTLDKTWLDLLRKEHFLVGLSIDGPASLHDKQRLMPNGAGTWLKAMQTARCLQDAAIPFNVLSVITAQTAEKAPLYWQWAIENGFDYLQPIPCLPPLQGQSPDALSPQGFFAFYQALFPLWQSELRKQHYISVPLFDNLIRQLNGLPSTLCGGQGVCGLQYVIESDGSVYPCDFYALDRYRLGNINHDSFAALAASSPAHLFLGEARRSSQACQNCPYMSICRRQCKRTNICYFNDSYCGYRSFLEGNYEALSKIAADLAEGRLCCKAAGETV